VGALSLVSNAVVVVLKVSTVELRLEYIINAKTSRRTPPPPAAAPIIMLLEELSPEPEGANVVSVQGVQSLDWYLMVPSQQVYTIVAVMEDVSSTDV
jgi:hypothetical protein